MNNKLNELPILKRGILTSGYVTLDIVVRENRVIAHRAGGTAGNVAANLAFLGWKAAVAGLLGRDEAGERLVKDLKHAGVAVQAIQRRPDVATPLVVHEIRTDGHRFRFSCPTCGARFPKYRPLAAEQARSIIASEPKAEVFFFDRASAATLALAEWFRETGRLVIFEPSTPGRAASFANAMRVAHIVKYSSEREAALRPLLEQATFGHIRIVTQGTQGVRIWVNRACTQLSGYPVSIVDTGGAGDWMTAGLLAFLPTLCPDEIEEDCVIETACQAQALAAISCAYPGARGLSKARTRKEVLSATQQILATGNVTPIAADVIQMPEAQPENRQQCGACLLTVSA